MAQERPSAYDGLRPDSVTELTELQQLLVGEYIAHLQEQRVRIDKLEASALESSQAVARSLAQAAKTDAKIRKVLYPVMEDALRTSVDDNPSMMAGILFPIIGEAVRKAVTAAMQQVMDSTNDVLAEKFSAESIKWRIEGWRTGKSFAEVAFAHRISYRVEHIYVIHRTTGLLLGQVTNQANLLQDSDMVVGMLTAIQDFVRDSFTSSKNADLDVIQVGEFKIWLQHGPIALLAAVISGQPKATLREVLTRQVEEIHKNFQVDMAHFETTGQSIPGLEKELKEGLVEEVKDRGNEPPKAPPSYTKFKVAGGVLAFVILAVTFFYGRRALNWSDYIKRLRHQPGIIILEEDRGWKTLTVRGFRDPMAVNPESLLGKYHLKPEDVSEHWDAYYSLDPRFANVRRLNNEAESLRKQAVRFQFDSTILPIDQLALLDNIGNQIQELVNDANQQGRYLRIRVYGHTDSTGTSQHNDMLSQYRAESIMHFLVSRGIDANVLSAAGLRDTQPEYNQQIEDGQDLDRRVTFAVDLR